MPTLSDLLRRFDPPPELRDTLARAVYNLGGGRVPFAFSTTTAANLVLGIVTGVMVCPPLNPGLDSGMILILGAFSAGPIGANGVRVDVGIRQGATVGGPLVGTTSSATTVAGNFVDIAWMAIDTPGAVAGMQYTLTGQAVSATVNSPIAGGVLIALALG